MPELKQDGYQSEHLGHDLLVTAFHLGEWAFAMPEDGEVMTEQELRRFEPHCYPSWVPDTDLHRPDGYSRVTGPNGKMTIAFEVELNEKSLSAYEHIARFYAFYPGIHKVLWLVETPSIARRIHSRLKTANSDEGIHNFVTCEEFFNRGWQSIVAVGKDEGKTLEYLLGNRRGIGGILVPRQYHLNVLKSPHKSKSSRFYLPGDFSN